MCQVSWPWILLTKWDYKINMYNIITLSVDPLNTFDCDHTRSKIPLFSRSHTCYTYPTFSTIYGKLIFFNSLHYFDVYNL